MSDVIIKSARDTAEHSDAPSTSGSRGLVNTLVYIDDANHHGEKIFEVDGIKIQGAINVFADDRDGQLAEIQARHDKYNGRAKKLSEHYILSYAEGKPENYTKASFERDIRIFLSKMGMSEHAVLYAVHGNTDNIHIHILVDRVAPYPKNDGQLYIPLETGVCVTKRKNGTRQRNDALCMQSAIFEICQINGWGAGNVRRDHDGKPTGKQRQGVKKQSPHTSRDKISLISEAEEVFSNSQDWKDAIYKLEVKDIKYEVSYDKNGKPKGAKISRNGTYAISSDLSKPNQYFSVRKIWGEYPDAPLKTPKQVAHDALHQSLGKSINLEELQRNVEKHNCILKISGAGFRIFVNNSDESFKPSQLGTTSKKIDQVFENNKMFRRTIDKKRKKYERKRVKRERAYLRKRKKFLAQRSRNRTISIFKRFFRVVLGILKMHSLKLPRTQVPPQKEWHNFDQVLSNLNLNHDMKPPFILQIFENGVWWERQFEDLNVLCAFVISYSEKYPNVDFQIFKKSLRQIAYEEQLQEDLYRALSDDNADQSVLNLFPEYKNRDYGRWSYEEDTKLDERNMILTACLPLYQHRQKIKNQRNFLTNL